jgi:hypothetical protein
MTTNTDRRPGAVKNQAQEHADQARTRMDAKRSERDEGLTGWLNKRAGEWELSGPDEATMQRQKYLWNFLVDTRVRRSCGTRGQSAFSGGADSARTGRCTAPLTTC